MASVSRATSGENEKGGGKKRVRTQSCNSGCDETNYIQQETCKCHLEMGEEKRARAAVGCRVHVYTFYTCEGTSRRSPRVISSPPRCHII